MNTAWIAAALVTGFALGAVYFGGLWLTVRSMQTMNQPALGLFMSFLLRIGIVLTGFYLVMDGHWERLVACLAGFLIARTLLVRCLRDMGSISKLPNA